MHFEKAACFCRSLVISAAICSLPVYAAQAETIAAANEDGIAVVEASVQSASGDDDRGMALGNPDIETGRDQAAISDDTILSSENYLDYYFRDSATLSKDVPKPDELLGFVPGEIHITPESLYSYVTRISEISPRAVTNIVGYSHEKRPLTNVVISSPANISNLENIRQNHLSAPSATQDDILVLKLAYSIHGNEPSGANAAPLVIHYLLSSKEPWVQSFLDRTVVIIEPVQNPDGLTRFSQWANTHRTEVPNTDPAQRNHHASWPSGRTNHYMFDLNRDWFFAVHPESKSRIREYYRWRPHVLGDYHEMGGSKPSYFFQPGHPKRTHPLTLPENQAITAELAKFHAKALDKTGQDYYTQERFDDFYYGKGSAYPDITGGIGLLFEQTAARGQLRDFKGEQLTFRRSVANQVTTSLSLMRGSDALRTRIINYRFEYQNTDARRSRSSKVKAYVFSDGGDPQRAREMRKMLAAHEIKIFALARTVKVNGKTFSPGSAWAVPTTPGQFGLVTSIFETRTRFADNVFYDVSTWNIPLSFNLAYAPLNSVRGILGAPDTGGKDAPRAATLDANATGYAIDWNQLEGPRFLQAMLAQGVFPRVAAKPFAVELLSGVTHRYPAGTLIVRTHDDKSRLALLKALRQAPSIRADGLATGLTSEGPDIGSRDMDVIYPVKLALVGGKGADTEETGEILHLLDKRVGAPVTLLDIDRVKTTDLSKYTHILIPDGSFSSLAGAKSKLRQWVKKGGVIVSQKRGAAWAYRNILCDAEKDKKAQGQVCSKEDKGQNQDSPDANDRESRAYLDYESDRGETLVNGAVVNANLDLTHPFAFGYLEKELPIFRTWNKVIVQSETPYDTPVRYTDTPLITGFIGKKKIDEVKGTPAVALHRLGKGFVITLADNLNFRGVWAGTSRLYMNIIFFSQTIDDRKIDD